MQADGGSYEGEWMEDLQHGKGKNELADGGVMIGCTEANQPVGQGVGWSADRARAVKLQDGEFVREISLEEAAQIVLL